MKIKFYKIFILFLLFSSISTAQKIEIGGNWFGDCYTEYCCRFPPPYIKHFLTLNKSDILDTNNISKLDENYRKAFNAVKEYIIKRGGEKFYDKIVFFEVHIPYWNMDSVNKYNGKGYLDDLKKCSNTKFGFFYIFSPDTNIQYRFGIALDDSFRVVSKHRFPDIKTNADIGNIIPYTKAIKIAEQKEKKIITPVAKIRLEYNDERNCFVWYIEQKHKIKLDYNYTPPVPDSYNYGYVIINAYSGELINSGKIKTRSAKPLY